jgi:hypothetical protein
MRERHGEGSGDADGAPPQSRSLTPLLTVVAFQGDRLALTLIMAADRQHQRVDALAAGAEQSHFLAREAIEQLPEGPLVAAAGFPVNQSSHREVLGFPDPDLVVFASQEAPHLIKFDHHRIARWRFAAVMIGVAAGPAQHRLGRRAEQVGHRVEGQVVAVQAASGALCRFGRAVSLEASELVAALLLARDDAVPDQAPTAVPWTMRKRRDH